MAEGCQIARQFKVATVCVKPCHVAAAAKLLEGSGAGVSSVLSFPHGADTMAIKVEQARAAVAEGATELDMVINIAALRDGDVSFVQDEIAAVVAAAEGRGVKVILECALLSDEQKRAGAWRRPRPGPRLLKPPPALPRGGPRWKMSACSARRFRPRSVSKPLGAYARWKMLWRWCKRGQAA